jgi:hypothetical protein
MQKELLSNQVNGQVEGHRGHELPLIIEGKPFLWCDQYITGRQVKELASLNLASELYLTISEPWKDELVENESRVDLARPGLEHFYMKQKLEYTINGKKFESAKQYIKGAEIRIQGQVPESEQIFLTIKGPWEDELIKDSDYVDLARPGIEQFYSKEVAVKVTLIVNGIPKSWDKKQISFKEVIILAYGNYIDNPTKVYTVGYEDGPNQNPEGSMTKDASVFVKDKMIFHATSTDKS